MPEKLFNRTETLIGGEGLKRLRQAKVAVFGVGGVGGFAAEALARAPVGELLIVDRDLVQPDNLNRQITATLPALGRAKTAVLQERLLSINPDLRLRALHTTLTPDNIGDFIDPSFDYVVDAIDSIRSKVMLLHFCVQHAIPVVSSMGAARKLDPARIRVDDISRTRVCPLAREVRKQLRRLGVHRGIKTVYSDEEPLLDLASSDRAAPPVAADGIRETVKGTISYLPATFGLFCGATVIRALLAGLDFPARGRADCSVCQKGTKSE